jgi:hypothetical protein
MSNMMLMTMLVPWRASVRENTINGALRTPPARVRRRRNERSRFPISSIVDAEGVAPLARSNASWCCRQ